MTRPLVPEFSVGLTLVELENKNNQTGMKKTAQLALFFVFVLIVQLTRIFSFSLFFFLFRKKIYIHRELRGFLFYFFDNKKSGVCESNMRTYVIISSLSGEGEFIQKKKVNLFLL